MKVQVHFRRKRSWVEVLKIIPASALNPNLRSGFYALVLADGTHVFRDKSYLNKHWGDKWRGILEGDS